MKEIFRRPPQKPASKPQKYIRTHFNKERIKIGAAIWREQQRKRVEDALQLKGDIEDELTQKEVEENICKEQLKKERAERYAQRTREKEEEEEEETGRVEAIMESGTQLKGGNKPKEPKKPHRSKGKAELVQEQLDEEEEEYEERVEG